MVPLFFYQIIKHSIYSLYLIMKGSRTQDQPVEPEGEDRFIDEALCDHVLEGWHDAVDADLRVAHAQNTIKLCCYECDTWLTHSFSESLIFHFNSCLFKMKIQKIRKCIMIESLR